MLKKSTIFPIVFQLIVSVRSASRNPIIANDQDLDVDCNFVVSSMSFLNNWRCVQFIFGHEPHSVECVRAIMENPVNVTFYTRSLAWLLNRNLYVEETSSAILNRQSTKFCENFLFILKDVNSLQSVLKSLKHSPSVVTLFPYSKLYFMFAGKQSQLFPSQTFTEISSYFRENAQFGYVYELHTNSTKIELKDFLSLNGTIPFNLIHPFVKQKNKEKSFRITLYNCNPFVLYVDEQRSR